MLDWPPLTGLTVIPRDGAALGELVAALQASPLWSLLPGMDWGRYELLIVALNRVGFTWLASSLVIARRPVAARWAKKPATLAGNILKLDATAMLQAGLTALVRGGWYELERGRYRVAGIVRDLEDFT